MAGYYGCTKCNVPETEMKYTWHLYKNGDKHIRVDCPKCGKYMGNCPKDAPYIRWVSGSVMSKKAIEHQNEKLFDEVSAAVESKAKYKEKLPLDKFRGKILFEFDLLASDEEHAKQIILGLMQTGQSMYQSKLGSAISEIKYQAKVSKPESTDVSIRKI